MPVTFNELAERELNDAIQYFEHEQSGLGAAFLAEVRRRTSASRNTRKPAWWSSAASGGDCASAFLTGTPQPVTRFAFWL